MDRVPMTPIGLEAIKKELQQIKAFDRPKVLKEVETAVAHGDLKENAEYHAAKERLAQLNARLGFLEERIGRAEVIDPKTMAGQTRVMFGATVTLTDLDSETEVTYQIVGDYESNIEQGKLSVSSPIARALIGKNKGDEVKVQTPKGSKEFEVTDVEYK